MSKRRRNPEYVDIESISQGGRLSHDTKGLLLEGDTYVWKVDKHAGPEHDTVYEAAFPHLGVEAQLSNLGPKMGLSFVHAGGALKPTEVGKILSYFEGYTDDYLLYLSVNIDLGTARGDDGFVWNGTVGSWRALLKKNPPPDFEDYEDGENDEEYLADVDVWVEGIRHPKMETYREILGRGGPGDVWEEERKTTYNPRGEWWIDDSGYATYADNEVVDTNHQGEAFQAALGISFEDTDMPEMIPNEPLSEEAIAWLREHEADEKAIEWLKDGSDPREYAMAYMGWIRVAGNNFQTHTFDDEALSRIRDVDGLWDEVDDSGVPIEESDEEVGIEDSKGSFTVKLKDLFDRTATAEKLRLLAGGEDWRLKPERKIPVARKGMSTDVAGAEKWQYRRIGENPRKRRR